MCMPEYSLVGQQDMGNSKIMIMDGEIADAGEMDEAARPGLRSGLLNRRSFLFGSAAGLGALGLAGCVTSDGMSRAEAAKLYGPVPDEKFPIPAVDVSQDRSEILSPDRALRQQGSGRHDHRRSRAITMFTASKATETPPAMAPMSAARVPVER